MERELVLCSECGYKSVYSASITGRGEDFRRVRRTSKSVYILRHFCLSGTNRLPLDVFL